MRHVTPLPYQIEDVNVIEHFDGVVLNSNEMGLGKTFETLWSLKRNPDWLPALVVCPASVKFNWKSEADVHFGMTCNVCESRTPPRYNRFDFSTQSPITIINYDILKNWLPYLQHLGFKTLVCDEVQAIANLSTIRTKAVQVVASWVKHVQMLSGTPLSNRPAELFPILNILWPDVFFSFTAYAQEFCSPRWTQWGWKYDGAANLPRLHEMLKSLGMIRRRKIDVMKDLPKMTSRTILCELSDPQEYNAASNDFMSWLRQNAAHRVRAAKRAVALTRLGMMLQLTARLKLRTPVDWSNRFLAETDEKLVLFAVHNKAVDVLQRRIEAKSVVIDGGLTALQSHAAVQQFQHDKETRVLIGTRTAWSGINLTAASTLNMLELWYRPGDVTQALARINRIGQKSACTANFFVAAGTIEERACEILQQKQSTIDAVLDGVIPESAEDTNIFDLLLDELQQAA